MISFQDAKAIVLNWRKTGARLPEWHSWWSLSPGEPPDEKPGLWEIALFADYPFPDDFAHWDARIVPAGGLVRSLIGCPPQDEKSYTCTLAHYAVANGYTLSAAFRQWDLLDSNGLPLIHLYLDLKRALPANFDQWEIATAGKTVAHAYLELILGPLPSHFDAWHLKDKDGQPVAHAAALLALGLTRPEIASFPEHPSIWLLRDQSEDTILHLYARFGDPIPEVFTLEDWHLANKHGQQVIDLARETGRAHLVAQYEALRLASGIGLGHAVKSSFRRGST